MHDLLNKKEDLNEELAEHLIEKPFRMIKHPLVFCIMYDEQQNALLNAQLSYKKHAKAEYLKKKDYAGYVFIHERPYRVHAFMEIADTIKSDKKYWRLLGDIWIDSENIWQNKKDYVKLMNSKRDHRDHFMSANERKHLALLPDKLTVYRGCSERGSDGMSWTTDKAKAEWFANRFKTSTSPKRKVITRVIDKQEVFAYMARRNESEIIIL